MVEMRGPSNSYISFVDDDINKSTMSPLFICEAKTLQEALDQYCREFQSTVRPYSAEPSLPPFEDGQRLAMIYDDPQSRFRDVLVVFSIKRDGKFVHDSLSVAFPLFSGDLIIFGTPGC